MREFKHGDLHSGSSKGPVVKNRKQAVAIALSEQRQQKKSTDSEQRAMARGDFKNYKKMADQKEDAARKKAWLS